MSDTPTPPAGPFAAWMESPAMQDFRRMLDVLYPPPVAAPAYARHRPGWRPSYVYLLRRRAARQRLIAEAERSPPPVT